MSWDPPHDPIFDPVGIVVWSIDSGLYDLMYSAWGWTIAEIVHFTGICLLIGTVGMGGNLLMNVGPTSRGTLV